MMDCDVLVDATGLKCPLPLLKAKQQLHKVNVGQSICVWATDEHAEADFRKYCKISGHTLKLVESDSEKFIFVICKSA